MKSEKHTSYLPIFYSQQLFSYSSVFFDEGQTVESRGAVFFDCFDVIFGAVAFVDIEAVHRILFVFSFHIPISCYFCRY